MKKDPLRKVYVHVGLVVALMAMVLAFSLIYVQLPPTSEPTGLVLVEYPNLGISDTAGEIQSAVKYSQDKHYVMLAFYTMWIMIVGMMAVLITEHRKK